MAYLTGRAQPREGAANKELANFVAELLGLAKSAVTRERTHSSLYGTHCVRMACLTGRAVYSLASGGKSREKVLAVEGLSVVSHKCIVHIL